MVVCMASEPVRLCEESCFGGVSQGLGCVSDHRSRWYWARNCYSTVSAGHRENVGQLWLGARLWVCIWLTNKI